MSVVQYAKKTNECFGERKYGYMTSRSITNPPIQNFLIAHWKNDNHKPSGFQWHNGKCGMKSSIS